MATDPITAQPAADGLREEIIRRREKTQASLNHWLSILEEAERICTAKRIANARDTIAWLRGYLHALDDVLGENP